VQEKRHARLVANASASARAEGTAPLVPLLVLERRGEEVAARADGVDKRTWRKLAQGDFAVAAELDLHGQTGAIAEERTVRFVVASRAAGHQAVAVVHGRGLHSGQEGPVLKDRVLALLTEGPVREHVLALASAPWRLGGPGVTLVLLRTKR
jgi:DNA-nicking Smr family endonuclease